MHNFLDEIRYAARQLRKNPGFTAVAVLTLALGLGANSAIFSVIDAVLLRPLPYHAPDRLVAVKPTEPGRRDDIGVSYPTFLDWRERNHVFDGLSVFRQDDFTLTGRGEATHLTGGVVSANLFSVLGVAPALGRNFIPQEDIPSSASLRVILSHGLWQSRFGSDPKILGQNLTLDGQTFAVVGVMPANFQFPVQRTPVEFWTTIALDAQPMNGSPPMTSQRGAAYLDAIARLRPKVRIETAQTEMAGIQDGLNRQYPENRAKGINLVPEATAVVGDMRPGLFILLGAVGLVLLIACANLSNLLLTRGAVRSKEISVRSALGATRWMIIRQLLAESVLLAAAGAMAGLALAAWGIRFLTALAPPDLPRITETGLNLEVLAFTAVLAILTSILFGLVPALQSAKPELILGSAGVYARQ